MPGEPGESHLGPSELGESCHVSKEHKMPGSTWSASRPRGLTEGVGITVVPTPEILRELTWSAVARAAAGDSRGSHTPYPKKAGFGPEVIRTYHVSRPAEL